MKKIIKMIAIAIIALIIVILFIFVFFNQETTTSEIDKTNCDVEMDFLIVWRWDSVTLDLWSFNFTPNNCNSCCSWDDFKLIGEGNLPTGTITKRDRIEGCVDNFSLIFKPTNKIIGNWSFPYKERAVCNPNWDLETHCEDNTILVKEIVSSLPEDCETTLSWDNVGITPEGNATLPTGEIKAGDIITINSVPVYIYWKPTSGEIYNFDLEDRDCWS